MKLVILLTVAMLAVTFGTADANPRQPDTWGIQGAENLDTVVRETEPVLADQFAARFDVDIPGNAIGEETEEAAFIVGGNKIVAGFAEDAAPVQPIEDEKWEEGVVDVAGVGKRGVDMNFDAKYVKQAGVNVVHGGKKYELPNDFDSSKINNETDVEKILDHFEDKVDKELKEGLKYITSSNETGGTEYRDCQHHYSAGARVNGVYTLHPWTSNSAFDVWCDFYTSSGEGWTLISRRENGNVFFYRDYATYTTGFGTQEFDHWLGLEKVRKITHQSPYILRIDLWDCAGSHRYAEYDYFALGPEETSYELLLGLYSGDAGDSLGFHRYSKFSTYDSDNDNYSGNCASIYKGGWWYNECYESNLNGLYYHCDANGVPPGHTGITYKSFGGYSTSLPRVEMKIRPYH